LGREDNKVPVTSSSHQFQSAVKKKRWASGGSSSQLQ